MSSRFKSFITSASLVIVSLVVFFALLEVGAYFILKGGGTGYYEREFRNSLRLRDPKDPEDVKGKPVILVLGDSFTYGFGVRYKESFPAQLDAALISANLDYPVVNAGIPGFDTGLAYNQLERLYEHYKPSYVILGFHTADIVQNQVAYRKFKDTAVSAAGEISGDQLLKAVEKREAEIPKIYLLKRYITKRSNIARLFSFYYKSYLIKYIPPPEGVKSMRQDISARDQFEASEYYLNKITDFLKANETQLILLSVVSLANFDAYPYHNINDSLENYALSNDVLFINPLEEFSKYAAADLRVSRSNSHYGFEGNKVMAKAIFDFLIENNILGN